MKILKKLWIPMLISAFLVWPLYDSFFIPISPEFDAFVHSNQGVDIRILLGVGGVFIAYVYALNAASNISKLFPRCFPVPEQSFMMWAATGIGYCMIIGLFVWVPLLVVCIVSLFYGISDHHEWLTFLQALNPGVTTGLYVLTVVFIRAYPTEQKRYSCQIPTRKLLSKGISLWKNQHRYN